MKRAAIATALFLGLGAAAPSPTSERYTPSGGWPDGEEDAARYERWFGNQLRAMGEPTLSSAASREGFKRRFRLLVLPTNHPAYAIRVDEPVAGPASVHAVRLDGAGGYSPGKILEQEHYVPNPAAIRRLFRIVAEVRLSEYPLKETMDGVEIITVCGDGVQFVFELVDGRGNHFFSRHACEIQQGLWKLVDATDGLRRTVGSDLKRYRRRSD